MNLGTDAVFHRKNPIKSFLALPPVTVVGTLQASLYALHTTAIKLIGCAIPCGHEPQDKQQINYICLRL